MIPEQAALKAASHTFLILCDFFNPGGGYLSGLIFYRQLDSREIIC